MLFAAVAAASLFASAEPLPRDTYLKREGDGWVLVRRGVVGLEILGSAEPPAVDDLAPDAGGPIFQPWTAIPTGSWPEAIAIGDVNGDFRKDVVLTTSYYFDPANDYQLFVFTQQPDGTLASAVRYPTLGSYTQRPNTVALGDVDGDGRTDVVIGNCSMGIGVFRQNAAGTLDPVDLLPTANSCQVRVADLNRDGLQDVVGLGASVSVLLQQPGGVLGTPVTYAVPNGGRSDLETADVNGDGRTDVIVMSGQLYAIPNLSVLYQQPDGTLGGLTSHFIGTNILSNGVGVGDLNGDHRNDVVLSYGGNSPSSRIAVFRQQANGTLAAPASLPSYDIPEPVEVWDADGDERDDVVVAHGGWNALGTYLQNSSGTLDPEIRYSIPYASHYNPHGIAVGDVNGDDAPEVVIADYNSGLVTLPHVPWAVTVTAPNTPVSWVIGSSRTITWTTTLPRYARVEIALSRDGGASWEPIASAPDTGSYNWTVTGPPTSQARIRVTWQTDRVLRVARSDLSDVNFTISTTLGSALAPAARRR